MPDYETRGCPKDRPGNPWANACQDMHDWGTEMETWGKKVNKFITALCRKEPCPEELQPGDPPPPPWKPGE